MFSEGAVPPTRCLRCGGALYSTPEPAEYACLWCGELIWHTPPRGRPAPIPKGKAGRPRRDDPRRLARIG